MNSKVVVVNNHAHLTVDGENTLCGIKIGSSTSAPFNGICAVCKLVVDQTQKTPAK